MKTKSILFGVATAAVVPFVLPALGFTAGGVAAGSLAAATQSVIYGGATTGVFSALQSAGAAGVSYGALLAIGKGAAEVAEELL